MHHHGSTTGTHPVPKTTTDAKLTSKLRPPTQPGSAERVRIVRSLKTQALNNLSDEQVESSAVFQPKQRTEKREAVTTANQSKTGPNPNLCPIRRQNRPLFEVPFSFPHPGRGRLQNWGDNSEPFAASITEGRSEGHPRAAAIRCCSEAPTNALEAVPKAFCRRCHHSRACPSKPSFSVRCSHFRLAPDRPHSHAHARRGRSESHRSSGAVRLRPGWRRPAPSA